MKTTVLLAAAISFSFCTQAQADTLAEVNLEEVMVKAFEQNRRLRDVPAAVNYIGRQSFERFGAASIVSAINASPGVRLEERSPGSYRFNIRGSSLRSPFGVRNVKVYYNDIPYTDPGGQTYLNQLGYYNFSSLEIIKGPGSSLYGAGTGGVLLIESLNENAQPGINAEYSTGSFGLQNAFASLTTGTDKVVTRSAYQHQESDGYRDHSALSRDILSWNGSFRFNEKRQLKTSFLYSDIFYQTPGALNATEYAANPKAARAGSANARAAIYQKTFVAGASYIQQITSALQNKSTLYGAFTELRNPNLRAYDRSSEPHVGGRSVFTLSAPFTSSQLTINAGAEWQQGFTTTTSYKNVGGNQDSLRYFDDISNRQSFLFAQASLEVKDWVLTAGASWNQLNIASQRFNPRALGALSRKFDNEIAPRISLLKRFTNISVYSSVAKGFSPPTKDELFPTGGGININLNAEDGINYDLGARGNFNGFYFDVNGFIYSLNNSIVRRVDANGGDFYVNAGKTKQHGVEAYLSYPLLQSLPFIKRSLLWTSYTWHNFHYKDFEQPNPAATPANQLPKTINYGGKQLPGIAQHSIAAGFDLVANNGLMANITYFYSDEIPVNDANTVFAKSFHLIGAKLGYERLIHNHRFRIYAGADNLLDEVYSLGNDINSQAAGRYFNAAAGRNYYAGIAMNIARKK